MVSIIFYFYIYFFATLSPYKKEFTNLAPTTPCDDDHQIGHLPSVSIIITVATAFCIMVIAIYCAFYVKRKLYIRSIKNIEHDTELEIKVESQRSSASSFLAIEVMTNTLSNIIKQQGGKIEVPN